MHVIGLGARVTALVVLTLMLIAGRLDIISGPLLLLLFVLGPRAMLRLMAGLLLMLFGFLGFVG